MDRSLQRERENFKRRALATPAIENKARKIETSSAALNRGGGAGSKAKVVDSSSFKSLIGSSGGSSSQYKFGVLARIVRHMRSRHQEGEIHALTLQEILDETNQLNVGPKIKQWLQTDALPNNPKLSAAGPGDGCGVAGGWVFNPALPVRDRKSLMKLLRMNDLKGSGGILVEDIMESVPQYAKVMKQIGKDVVTVTRQTDKKQIVYFHDRNLDYEVDPEFQQLWRNTSVDGLHDDNIDDYLTKQGIKSMQDVARFVRPIRRKTKARRQMATKISDNDHLAHILKDYEAL